MYSVVIYHAETTQNVTAENKKDCSARNTEITPELMIER